MTDLSVDLRRVIEGQLSNGESVSVEYTRESESPGNKLRSTVVTDRRVIDAVASEGITKDKSSIENFFFRDPAVCEVSYTEENHYTFLQALVRLFGGTIESAGKEKHVVEVRTDENEVSFEFENEGREIARAIASLAGDNQG